MPGETYPPPVFASGAEELVLRKRKGEETVLALALE